MPYNIKKIPTLYIGSGISGTLSFLRLEIEMVLYRKEHIAQE